MKRIILIIALIIFSSTYGQGKLPKSFIPAITSDMIDPSIELGGGTSNPNIVAVTNLTELNAIEANTIASIQDTIDLATTTVNLPANVVLLFEGGRIINGELIANNTVIKAFNVFDEIFNEDVELTGDDWQTEAIYPEWFGAKSDGLITTDNTIPFNLAFDFARIGAKVMVAGGGNYYIAVVNQEVTPTNRGTVKITHSGTFVEFANNSYLAVIPNLYEKYILLAIESCDNITLYSHNKSGGLKGDFINGKTAYEFGHTLSINYRTTNVTIDGLDIADASGDGFMNTPHTGYITSPKAFEQGSINNTTGALESSITYIRNTEYYNLTSTLFNPANNRTSDYQIYKEFHVVGGSYGGYSGINNGLLDLYFYDAAFNYISTYQDVEMYDRIKFPENAVYCKIGAKQSNITYTDRFGATQNVQPNIKADEISVGLTIKNCWIHDSSRNNISITGAAQTYIYNNILEDAKGTLPMANIDIEDYHDGNKNTVIEKNIFRNGYNYDIVTVSSWGVTIINNQFLGQKPSTHLATITTQGRGVTVKNNYIEWGEVYVADNGIYQNNESKYTTYKLRNGVIKGDRMFNSIIMPIEIEVNTINENNGEKRIEDVLMYNDINKLAQTGYAYSYRENATLATDVIIDGLKIYGYSGGSNDLIRSDNTHVLKMETNKKIDIYSPYVDNLTAPEVDLWYVPQNNEVVTYRNWKITGATAFIKNSAVTTNLHHLVFKNLILETERIAFGSFGIDIDNNLGSLTLENTKIIDRGTTGTNWFLINIDNAVDKLKIINSEFVTATAGSLIDIGTSTATGFLYKDNILDNVVLNGRTTDILRSNIINGVEKSQYPTYADNAAALSGGLTAGQEYITSTGVKMVTY